MKKLLTLLIVAVLSCLLLVGCGEAKWESTISEDTYQGKAVKSNGGFLVEKGDYIYFINGVETNTADNTLGTPVRGSIVRQLKSQIATKNAEPEIVVPKVVFNSDYSNGTGLFIFGDYIYYATPCSDKNSNGVIRNSEVEYCRVKLNGKDASVITTVKSTTTKYRFVEIDDVVYLVMTATDDDGGTILKTINCDTKEVEATSKVYTEYVLASDVNCKYAFYTAKFHDEVKDLDKSYNAVYRFALDGSDGEGKVVLFGIGKNDINSEDIDPNGEISDDYSTQTAAGVTFDIVAFNGKQLFIKEDAVITTTTSWYYGIEDVANVNAVAEVEVRTNNGLKKLFDNYNGLEKLDTGRSISTTVFADTSIYINLRTILYLDSARGVIKFDYKATEAEGADSQKRIVICDKEFALTKDSHVIKFIDYDNGYVYSTDSSNNYYRTNLGVAVNLKTGEQANGTPTVRKVSYAMTPNTSWFLPEIVTTGTKEFMLASISGNMYGTYIYAIDMNAAVDLQGNPLTGEALEEFEENELEQTEVKIRERLNCLVGIKTQGDIDACESYISSNF